MKKSFLKIFSVITVAVTIISCDKDFNTVGSDVIGDDHFNLEKVDYDVVAYNKATGPVQTNNLTVNAFGVATLGNLKAPIRLTLVKNSLAE